MSNYVDANYNAKWAWAPCLRYPGGTYRRAYRYFAAADAHL